MSCNITIPDNQISKRLREITGSNYNLFMSYMTEIMSEDGFTKDFIDKLKDKLNIDIDNIPNDKIDDVVNYVREYYNLKHPDINFTATIQNESTSVGSFGYSSINAREFGKRITANFTLDFYHQILHDNGEDIDKVIKEDGYKSKKAFFADAVKARIEEILANRISSKTGLSVDEIYDIMDEGDIAKLEKLNNQNSLVQDNNVLALYKEMIGNREGFFTEVFRDSRLGDIRIDNSEEISEDISYESTDEQNEDNEGENVSDDQNDSINDDKNNTIKELNEKLGDYNNFMTHVDMSIRSYLNSLKKLNSGQTFDKTYDYDTNNELGIPDTMNADECCSVLYSYGDFTNVETMIRSITEIANNIPGFAAFHQMADYLSSNSDFAYEVYRTFGKTIISKMETVMDGSRGVSRTSNRSADKLTSLRFEYLNSVKATSVLIDDLNSKAIFDDFNEKLKSLADLRDTINDIQGDDTFDVADRLAVLDEIESHKSEIVAELARQLRRYYPTIEDTAIANYISNAKNKDIIENARNLASILRDTINASYLTQQAYNSRQAEIGKYYAKQKNIENRRIEGEKVEEDYTEQLADLYATSYVDKSTEAAAFRLANELVRFTMVKTELNSRNVHGNQSSDVINNSMITNIMNTLKSQIALGNFGKYKSQSRQYDFSNIMVEHRDKNNRIINYGLFTHNPKTNEFTPTDYAERLLRARLFSGASDIISSANVLYSEMSKGDYVATSFVNFFNIEESAKENDYNIDFANYFMRIPSDSPKNFIITAPKYFIGESRYGANDGLFKIENINEVNRTIQQRINSLATITEDEYLEKYSTLSPTKRTLKQLISNATSKNVGNITINSLKQLNEDNAKIGEDVTMTFSYVTKDGIDNTYVMKGTLGKDNGRFILQAPEFIGFVSPAHSSDVNESLRNYFMKKMIKSKEINRTININHPIYQQFRNIFIQELNDAANALDKFFVNENGLIALDKEGKPIFRKGFANDDKTARMLYATYHVAKGKTILEYNDDGKAKLTGTVFSSDRFKITTTDEKGNVNVRNYGNEIIDEAFSFLYGGANQSYLRTTRSAKGVSVNLTPSQETKITEKLSEFINDYIENIDERIQQYKDFIPEHLMTEDNIAEFALNYRLMYVGFNDLFEGDTKFYKDTQTFLKRAKESQGSGVPYGIVDYNIDTTADITHVPSRLDETEFTKINEDRSREIIKYELRSKFKGITIKNTVRTSKEVAVKGINGAKEHGIVTKNLIKALRESGMPLKDAEAKAINMMKGFHDTTVNDAQSYITFEEWVRRITARGQLPKYKPLIDAILDESKPLDAATIGKFIQVQKNFYYDQHYNEKLGVIAPRQIKNAEFVLVPRLIRGTQLEKVYNMMRDNDIDQLNTEETSKAGKCNVLTIWNNDGEITEEAIADFKANAPSATELYDYNHLYTQQETPQHVAAQNKAGIQIMKKIMDNIDSNSPLYPLKEKFFSLYSANIKDSFADLVDELGLKTDENGNLLLDENGNFEGLNYNLFYSMLQDEVARLGLDSNMLDYVTVNEDGTTNMPTYMSNVSTKLESIAQSLFNSRITRQKLPGFHAAQITNIGFKPMNEQVTGRTYSKELRYHPEQYQHKTTDEIISWRDYNNLSDEEKKNYKNIGAAPYVEVMLPVNNFGLKRTKEDGTLKTDEELLKELQDAGLDMMIGYRIPTEGKQSICIMKVVGFTDDALGSTIVVPDDWVAQTGSDFDIDSVYGINFSGEINKKTGKLEKIKYNSEAKRSIRKTKGRNNELLQIMIDILSDEASLEENLARSNFDYIIKARDKSIDPNIAKLRKNRSPYDFFDQAEYQEDVMSGAKLKAFSVTRDTFCSICNTVRPNISSAQSVKIIYRAEDGYSFKNLKKSFDNVEEIDEGIFVVTHDTFGWSKNNKNTVGELITAYSSQTTAHILDAVKEGAIPNVNDLTFQVYKLFPDLGSDYDTGVSFIMQPGISRIVAAYNSNKSIYSRDNKNPVHTAIRSIARELFSLDGVDFNERDSIDNIINKLSKYSQELSTLFGAVKNKYKISLDDAEVGKLLISASRLRDRLKEEGIFKGSSPVEERRRLLFDLGTILQYNKLSHLGNSISAYARVCNPDKFGAKQSIFATEKVFKDIKDIIYNESENRVLDVYDDKKGTHKNLLEAIYPGLTPNTTIDEFIRSNDMQSSYPPLHHFLKYATATSIKINRQLFLTQNEDFVKELYKLQEAFSGTKSYMTEKLYKDYQNYILNYLYGQTDAVRNKVTFILGEGFKFEAQSDTEAERRRIFGYGKNPDLRVEDNHGNMVEFTVNDINNPTQTEINQFATLSPAQKITWIQGHFRNSGAFKYIRTTLFNERQYRRTKAGAQTIEFVEGNANIETVYHEFEKCFYNSNPLVALTALDIVKYAFVVEGFRMRRNAVNKMIKNNVLMGEIKNGSTGIVNQLNDLIKNITTASIDMDSLRNDFVRSHPSMSQIETHRVEKKDNKSFELQRMDDGIIYLNVTDDNSNVNELAEKYGFVFSLGDNGNYGINQYVKLRFGKVNTLYKIRVEGRSLIAYPLNLLEENESGTWSVNVQNNKFADESYYKEIVDEWFSSTDETTLKQIIEKHQENKKEHKFVNKNRTSRSTYATTFDINAKKTADTGGFEDIINKVSDYFSSNPKGKLYVRSMALSKYITHTGADNGSIQTINGRQYLIQKADFSRYNKLYIGSGKENREIKEKDPQIRAIMERAQSSGYKVNDAFVVTPFVETTPIAEEIDETPNEIRHSSVTELGVNSMNAMYRRQVSEGDISAANALKRLHDKDIVSKDASVKANIAEVITTTAEYVQVTTDKILNDLEYFIQDVDGHYHSVNESTTIDLIRNNPEERKRFLKTLLDARAFVRNYRIINELDIDSEDASIRHNLSKIKNSINKLQNATIINNAEEKFANEYLAKLSNNPLIQNDILTLLDGYHSAGAFDAWVNDLQETSSPLLQIITKEVMADIRAKEMQANQRIREFKSKVEEIKAKAKAAGVNIDWKNIIDEDGKFIQDYNQAFIDEISKLRDEINKAKIDFGEGSIEHLRAKFAYDKFKLNHINQPLVDEYYESKLKLEQEMIDNFPTVYSAYKKLEAKRRNIYSHIRNGALEESYQEELKAIKKEIDDIVNPYFFNPISGEFNEKFSVNDPNNPSTGESRVIYSLEAANAISNYLGDMKILRKIYFAQDAKFGFDEELEKNLDIINNYEQRDNNGRITTPMSELMKHDDYVKAKEWVEHNARYVIDESLQEMINDAFRTLRETSADRNKLSSTEVTNGRKILTRIAKKNEAYDSRGVIDATKFSDKDIEEIRKEQLANYNIREGQPYSDRSLISNSPTDDTVFLPSFYSSMRSNGIPNQEYIKLVNKINEILAPYYDNTSRTLYTSDITEEDLSKLVELYDKIEDVKKTTNSTNGKAVRKYIKQNVDFVIDYEKYNTQKDFASQKGARYLRLWQQLNERIEEDENGNDIVVPNRRIYGYAVPKGYKQDGTGNNSMVDRAKTKALQTIHSYTSTVKTEYYYQKYKEMRAKSDKEFNTWYNANHIYNPYTHTREPLQCWTRMQVNSIANDGEFTEGGMWVPAFNQLETRPKDGRNPGEEDYTNHDYKPSSSTASNYKKDSKVSTFKDNIDYSNNNSMNEFERQMKELFESTLRANAHTTAANRFLDKGYMASRAKSPERDAAFYAKESAKMIGWIEGASGREAWYEDIDYANDKTIDMPMLSILKSKDSVTVNRTPPERTENMSDEEYKAAVKKYEDDKKKAEEQNAKIHREMLDNDWESVMEEFITKAAHFNAVQDNKYMLFYAKNMLDKLDVFVKNEGFNDLQRDNVHSSEDQNRYVTKKDTRLQEQFANWIRRLVYDQWKKPNNNFTRFANIAQSLTSAKFMMLNVTGGIANITVGETQILSEALAKEYFGLDTWAKGMNTWNAGIPSFFADMYSDKASSLASAIVKFMNVVDFDELNGVVNIPNAEEYMKRARDLMFSPQAMGEHMMQNGAMFSMMHSHRLVVNSDKENNGKLSYTIMNEAEYTRNANERALQSILTDEQKELWNKFIAHETSDANTTKEYAWFRKDLTTEFANIYLNNEQKKEFISKRREIQKQAKEEFNNDEIHPTVFSQLKLGSDGKLDFKDDSIFSQLGDEAYQLLGEFKGRVISVNKKIHGVYDKLGAAKWESYWWGGIVMQYHKHIYPGIMKRYRRQGYFNEERGTIEKGCYDSIKDFLAIPLHKAKYAKKLKEENNMSDSELQAVQGIQNIIRNYVEFATHIRTNWNMIPESERGNIKRAIGDMAGVMSALCLAIGLQVIGGDDDEHNLLWNLSMYEADRLASESFMYNPIGITSEGKKLWSSPIAAQTGVSDLLSTAGLISQYILQGDDFDPYYQSGLYAGENKLEIKLKRNIPMYHGINMLERLNRSNKYYKLGDNMLTIVPIKDIADWINE